MSTSRPSLASRTAWDGVSRSFGDVATSRWACTRVAGPLAGTGCATTATGGGSVGAGVATGTATVASGSSTWSPGAPGVALVASGSIGASCALSAGIGAERAVKSSRELDSCGADVG